MVTGNVTAKLKCLALLLRKLRVIDVLTDSRDPGDLP